MKSEVRLLPRLDSLYLKKKSYEIHRKKIESIKRSNTYSKNSPSLSRFQLNDSETNSNNSISRYSVKSKQNPLSQRKEDFLPKTHMQTIQQNKPVGLQFWLKKMNPHQKRLRQEQIKENKRIREKIKNTTPFITRKNQLTNHEQHYSGMKRMLSRFSIDENSQKTKMKCEIVLRKINQVQKSRLKLQQSRLMLFDKMNKSFGKQKTSIQITQKQQNVLTKRSNAMSERESIFSKKSTSSIKDNIVKNFTSISNIKQRFRTEPRMNQTELVKNHIPSNLDKSSQRYNRVKTQFMERASEHRLFNKSKLSNLSIQSNNQSKAIFNQNKILRVNQNPLETLKKLPQIQRTSSTIKKGVNIKSSEGMKAYLANKIKTCSDILKNLNREKLVSRFDYQKKKIERFLKSKTSSTPQQENIQKSSVDKLVSNIQNKKVENRQQNKKEENRQQNIKEENRQDKIYLEMRQNKSSINIDQNTYFATEIQ